MLISFLMMAKNVEKYIGSSIVSLQESEYKDWELIIIDDHSEDDTFNIALEFSKKDSRLIVRKNPFQGKVEGTSYAYSLSSGEIIKCIDSDDILLKEWFNHIDLYKEFDSHCHSAKIVTNKLDFIASYNINKSISNSTYEDYIREMKSIPKWSWSFKRKIAEHIFPLPSDLPFEDVWISFIIKKHSDNIKIIEQPLYLYRQHDNQTFGGIVNFNKDVIEYRARRILKLIDVLKLQPKIFSGSNLDSNCFTKLILFNSSIIKNSHFIEILSLDLSLKLKAKLILFLKTPKITKYIIILKWKFDKLIRT